MKKYILLCLLLSSAYIAIAQNSDKITEYQQAIAERDSALSDTKLKNSEQIRLLEEIRLYKDSIIHILNAQIETDKKDLAIKEFFCCPDTSVFGSKFIENLDITGLPTHMREYYQLVNDIRSAAHKLISIETIVEKTKSENKDLKEDLIQEIHMGRVGNNIIEIGDEFSRLAERNIRAYLTETQVNYYNEYLGNKFNELWNIINN